MRILVTGATGFVGRHLMALAGDEYVGVSRHEPAGDLRGLTCDLTDSPALAHLLAKVNPEGIIHLAGYANAGRSFQEPEAAWAGNLEVTLSLYRAVEQWGGRPPILFVSSGMVYGTALSSVPVCDESTPLLPNSPYGASKAAADLASYQVFCHPGLQVIRVRPFNQIGPGQSVRYSVPAFAEQLARIEARLAPPVLQTGNLDATRDLTDVRDMVRAYRLLLEYGTPGEVYNAASGAAVSMRRVVDELIAVSGCQVEVQVAAERVRPQEVNPAAVSADKLRAAMGWMPAIPLRATLRDVLNEWRAMMPQGRR